MKPDSTATAQRRSEYTARRSRDETVWSLLIVALVVLVIWSGWRSRAPEGTAAIDSQASLESESAPVDEPTDDAPPAPDAASSAVEPDPGFVRDVPEVSAAYRAPEIHVAFKHLYSLYNLPSQGWIRSPLITPEWLESFDHFCKIVARRDPADCAVQRILLLRMSSAPGGELDPWITQMQEWLGEELEKGLGGVDLHAFQVTCGREGCLLFLATASGAD